jgi:hypothetical protein
MVSQTDLSLSVLPWREQAFDRLAASGPQAGRRLPTHRSPATSARLRMVRAELCPQLVVTPLRSIGDVCPRGGFAPELVGGGYAVTGKVNVERIDTYDPGTTVRRAPV